MARDIYSFTKVQKNRTNKGIYATVVGAVCIVCIIALIVTAFVMNGALPEYAAGIGCVSFIASVIGYNLASRANRNDDVYGKFIKSGVIVNLAAIGMHFLIVLIGILSIIG